ncbi:MAG: c-type cytochrome biogenesis protein CcmI, partial [Betaproteobacteria bacterium]
MVRAVTLACGRIHRPPPPRPSPAAGAGSRTDRLRAQARGRAPCRKRGGAPVTAFVVLGAVLIAGALLFVVPPLLRRSSRTGATRDAVNVAVYRDQLRELDADLRAGTLASDQHEKARREIEARLLADVG